ncbi:hypothetical protein F5Y03DRAFT_399271 [Xylaria venustula]|nr:hypothetical protein F5Y03DRAFT_399271 [Xylaria venustula]
MQRTTPSRTHISNIVKSSLATNTHRYTLPRFSSTQSTTKDRDVTPQNTNPNPSPDTQKKKKKTMAELDEELKLKMSGIAGDGGEAGIEYEDGQPVAMKRGVKNNMFRYI